MSYDEARPTCWILLTSCLRILISLTACCNCRRSVFPYLSTAELVSTETSGCPEPEISKGWGLNFGRWSYPFEIMVISRDLTVNWKFLISNIFFSIERTLLSRHNLYLGRKISFLEIETAPLKNLGLSISSPDHLICQLRDYGTPCTCFFNINNIENLLQNQSEHVRPLVGWLVCWLVLKGGKLHFQATIGALVFASC